MKKSLLVFSLLILASCTRAPVIPADPEVYYNGLKTACGTDRCCLTSVNQMKNKGVMEAGANGCAQGQKEGHLTCEGSKKWCEAETSASGTTN